MTDEDVTTEERLLLSTVYDLWSAANGVWPLYAQVDKQLDGQAIDAEAALRSVFPRLVRLDSGSLPPQASQQLSLTVRALAELPGPPQITETFTAAVRYLASREQAHDPQPPDDLEPKATSADFGQYLETSASIPRPPQVAAQLAQSVGELLRSEGHLHTYFGADDDGGWEVTVSRRVRRFRGTTTLDDYLARVDEMFAAEDGLNPAWPGRPQSAEVENVVEETVASGVDPRKVFVVHGRDLEAKRAVYGLLRDLDLLPLDWEELVAATGSAAPYVGDTVSVAFRFAQAVVVVLTPDDEARLLPALHGADEPPHEVGFMGQARPNVLFEAGMALASHPDRTIFVEIGKVRPFSDVTGRHMVRLTGAASTLHAVATRLGNAGCPVNVAGAGWLDESRFKNLEAHSRRAGPNPKDALPGSSSGTNLPFGTVLPASQRPPTLRLSATVHVHENNYLVEIANKGSVALRDIDLVLPPEAGNWHLMTHVLPSWPIAELAPRAYLRIPTVLSLSGPVVVEARLTAKTAGGESYEQPVTLSVYG